MFMTQEKIEAKIEAPSAQVEHPAYRAARMIKELHEENIAKIDGGFVFLRDGVDCSEEMRAACVEQIADCEAIMKRVQHLDPILWEPAALILGSLETKLGETLENEMLLPEIGNYDHEKDA